MIPAEAQTTTGRYWTGPVESLRTKPGQMLQVLHDLERPCYAVWADGRLALTQEGCESGELPNHAFPLLGSVGARDPSILGDPEFRRDYGVQWAYMSGAMAHGIASVDLVTAMGRAGLLGTFGAAGVPPADLEGAIIAIQRAVPSGPFAFNLIFNPNEGALERAAVDLYLRHGITKVEASSYLDLSPHVVRYRVAGLRLKAGGGIVRGNRIIAKLSRREVATRFMSPPPARIVADLYAAGAITAEQARLAEHVTMCDDVTVEADSGGHTDKRPLIVLLPSMCALRDELAVSRPEVGTIRIGAAGGIGTPEAALAAFAMGAAYVVTGSINQGTVEAATSEHVKRLLASAGYADITMAPSADLFELGARVQLLKRGSLYPMRAQWLYDLYRAYDSLDNLPPAELHRLERQLLRCSVGDAWAGAVDFFSRRDPAQIARAEDNPKRRMALVFRWYLGQSSRWAEAGEPAREADYQVWCGPAIGAFNDWVRSSYLEEHNRRHVVDIAREMMCGTAFLSRITELRAQGVSLPHNLNRYRPGNTTLECAAGGTA